MKYDAKGHWEKVWTRKKSNEVSWYQKGRPYFQFGTGRANRTQPFKAAPN